MPKLRVFSHYGENYTYPIENEAITIGRSADSDIAIADHTVSRKHARIQKSSKGYVLKDLKSHNGTHVNGTPIDKHLLKHQDVVKIGAASLTFLHETAFQPEQTTDSGGLTQKRIEDKSDRPVSFVSVRENAVDQQVVASIKSADPKTDDDLLSQIEPSFFDSKKISAVDLEKSSKALYVLYQISRQLNQIADFDELMRKIMDLIFKVIDADHGFVVVLGDGPDEIIPKVVKHRSTSESTSTQDLNELNISRTIINKVVREKASVLTSNAMEDAQFEGAKSILMQNIRSIMSVPLYRKDEVIGLIQLDSFRMSTSFTKTDLELLRMISSQMSLIIEQANLNEKIRCEELARNRLERFHSPEVVDLIASGEGLDEDAIMAPKEKKATILFSDIVGFTSLSERLPPAEISALLNLFFGRMTDVIFDLNGTLDKYIGDAIMAVFGAPIERANDAERAIAAALDMRKTLREILTDLPEDRRFDMRIGINTGTVVAGNLGSPRRMDYTVIGDAVNTAARLESIAEPGQILIGEETYHGVKRKFNIRNIGSKAVRGKADSVMVYEVLD